MSDRASIEKAWTSEAGLECVAVAINMGHRCGYVRVPEDHPWFGLNYSDDVPEPVAIPDDASVDDYGFAGMIAVLGGKQGVDRLSRRVEGQIRGVHGGLTFAGTHPIAGETPDGWWFGFDCAHLGDAKDPTIMSERSLELEREMASRFGRDSGETIRTLEFVVEECERLAEQLAEAV